MPVVATRTTRTTTGDPELADNNQLTVRIAYNLFTQKPKEELADFKNWTSSVKLHGGNDFFRHNGAGEMLVFSAADFEDFLEPRPDLPQTMEQELEPVVRHLVEQRWPFRLHATYNESISRMLDVFEKVNRDIPFNGLPWFFDHAETITPQNIERVRALGGGIAIQDRMAFRGILRRPLRRQGCRADATDQAHARHGRAGGRRYRRDTGVQLQPVDLAVLVGQRQDRGWHGVVSAGLSRETALQLFTQGSAWFSSEQGKKGQIKVGQLADLAALSLDFFSVDEEAIKGIESVLTIVDGKVVYGAAEFDKLGPPQVPVLPEWSPVTKVPGHWRVGTPSLAAVAHQCVGPCGVHAHSHEKARHSTVPVNDFRASGERWAVPASPSESHQAGAGPTAFNRLLWGWRPRARAAKRHPPTHAISLTANSSAR